jgi:hypothetical protein
MEGEYKQVGTGLKGNYYQPPSIFTIKLAKKEGKKSADYLSLSLPKEMSIPLLAPDYSKNYNFLSTTHRSVDASALPQLKQKQIKSTISKCIDSHYFNVIDKRHMPTFC